MLDFNGNDFWQPLTLSSLIPHPKNDREILVLSSPKKILTYQAVKTNYDKTLRSARLTNPVVVVFRPLTDADVVKYYVGRGFTYYGIVNIPNCITIYDNYKQNESIRS